MGIVIGSICGSIFAIIRSFSPQYYHLARTIFNISIITIFLLGLIVILCFIIGGELIFQIRINQELAKQGYSTKTVEMFKKRKKKFENNKYNMTYMQTVSFLANERLLYYDYESAYKYLEEIDFQEFYDKLKIGSGKAKLMNVF